MVEVKIVADSLSPQGIRLTTMQLRYPRFIHAELMTHRVFSRNARSSRAVPVGRLMEETAYVPHFMKNQPGMQSFQQLSRNEMAEAIHVWLDLVQSTRDAVEKLQAIGVHKQWANRPLEWFGFIDVLVSSTEWANWYELRDHPAAMPEIQELARAMREAHDNSVPRALMPGEWHLPYVDPPPPLHMVQQEGLCKVSAARCARLSYKPFDSETADPQKDMELFQRLLVDRPVHASPAEHQGTPDELVDCTHCDGQHWKHPELHGNFTGWIQFRKTLEHEAVWDKHHENLPTIF